MVRSLLTFLLFAACGVTLAQPAQMQSAAPLTYDVSTVKPSVKGGNGMSLNWGHGQLKADNVTLTWILTAAFDIRPDQLTGQPDWATEQRYDIHAKLLDTDPAADDNLTEEQHQHLLLTLLVERFGLKYHVETKEMATYNLLPATKGLKLTAAADSGDKTKQVYGMCSNCFSWGDNNVKGHDMPVDTLARLLAAQLERTVNNRTGYDGKIDINLKWAPDLGAKPASDEDASLPPLPKALEEQLGLHLQPSRGPVKIYVVDHMDKPSDN